MSPPLRIALICPDAWPPLAGWLPPMPAKGVTAATLARAIAALPDTSAILVTASYGQPSPSMVDGIEVRAVPSSPPGGIGNRIRRALHRFGTPLRSRETINGHSFARLFVDLFETLAADAYVVIGLSQDALPLTLLASRAGRPVVVLALDSDDVAAAFYRFSGELAGTTFGGQGYYILRHGNLIQARTAALAEACAVHTGFAAEPEAIAVAAAPPRPGSGGSHILWHGRLHRGQDRPLALLEIAELLPEIPFVMAIHPLDQDLFLDIQKRRFNTQVCYAPDARQTESLFADAAVYVDTAEAGRNSYGLSQAARHGTPIISQRNSDFGITPVGDDPRVAAQMIETLLASPDRWNAASAALHDTLASNHAPPVVAARLLDRIRSLCGR